MTLCELEKLVDDARWFSRLGDISNEECAVSQTQVEVWDWLPTSLDQTPPLGGEQTRSELKSNGKNEDRNNAEMSIARKVMVSLRPFDEEIRGLKFGPENLAPAARSGARIAARMAVREILLAREGPWCTVMRLYSEGFWPCGLTPDERVVLF